MAEKAKIKSLENEKLQLITMRMKNKYYDKDSIIDKVVEEIIRKEISNLK